VPRPGNGAVSTTSIAGNATGSSPCTPPDAMTVALPATAMNLLS